MKIRVLSLLVTCCLLISAAWIMRTPDVAQADDVPEKYRETVRKGLDYLVKNQSDDGHWEGGGGKHPVATTALAGIALLMDGNGPKGKYAANLRKAADWLLSKSQAGRDGLIFSGHASETDRYMDGHGLATQFLAWSCRDETNEAQRKKLYEAVSRAVGYIARAQSTQGGWYRTSRVEGHDFAQISTTAIQLQALQLAGDVGAHVDGGVRMDGQAYLKTEIEKQKEEASPAMNPGKAAETAAALVCRSNPYAFLDQDGVSTNWRKRCARQIPMGRDVKFGRDDLTHYWYAQTLFNDMLNDTSTIESSWSDYRNIMFDHLQSNQAKDGSWPAASDAEGGIGVGPIHSTAVWCAVLQFDKKCHPLTQVRANHLLIANHGSRGSS